MRRACDVLVVGGGPAGAATAALLARKSIDVLLVDRATFPRGKACGESLNPGAVRELEQLGWSEVVGRLPSRPIAGWQVHPSAGPSFSGRFPERESALAIDRLKLDFALLKTAASEGAEVRTGVTVTDVVRKGAAVAGVVTREHGEIRARVVVGADGLRSVVMRRLGLLGRAPLLRKVGLTAHVEGARLRPGIGELHTFDWGCAGLVEVDRTATNVAIVLTGAATRLASGDPSGCFDRFAAEVPALRHAVRTGPVHATGPFDYPTRAVTVDGALLVGDAAGYYDPFTGEGIYRALRGARVAADVLGECFATGSFSAASMRRYSVEHSREFTPAVWRQRVIEAVISRPGWLGAVAAGMCRSEWAADRLMTSIGDVPRKRLRYAASRLSSPPS